MQNDSPDNIYQVLLLRYKCDTGHSIKCSTTGGDIPMNQYHKKGSP